jgi:hypothetical protein
MIKLINLLKELTTRPKPELGRGEQGTVYPLGKNKIIKKSNWYDDGMSKQELRDYKIFNQHPDVFPHIYKITKHYVIMDKLNTSLEEFKDINLRKFIAKNGWWESENPPAHGWTFNSKTGLYDYKYEDEEPYIDDEDVIYNDPFTQVYRDLRDNNLRAFNHVFQKAKEQGETKIYNALKEALDLCVRINKAFKGQFKDVHMNNIGRDSSGKLKIFDVTLDDI